MKNWIRLNRFILVGVTAGAIGGYLYWQQIGCDAGTCPITSRWHNSTIYGAVMGGLLFSIFKKQKKDDGKKTDL